MDRKYLRQNNEILRGVLRDIIFVLKSILEGTFRFSWYLVKRYPKSFFVVFMAYFFRWYKPRDFKRLSPRDIDKHITAHRDHKLSLTLRPPATPKRQRHEVLLMMNADHIRKRMEFYAKTKYASILGAESVFDLLGSMTKINLLRGEHLFKANEETPRGMYLVSQGTLALRNETGCELGRVKESESLCEFALVEVAEDNVDTTRYNISCAAVDGPAEVYVLGRRTFEAFTRSNPQKLVAFVRTVIAREWRVSSFVFGDGFLKLPITDRRKLQGDIGASWVGSTDPFDSKREEVFRGSEHTDEDDWKQAVPRVPPKCESYIRVIHLQEDETLMNVDEYASSIYLVRSGHVRALSPKQEVLSEIPVGCVVGGISFLGGTVRGESIVAGEDNTSLFEIQADHFSTLLTECPDVLYRLVRAVARQLSPICRQSFELGVQTNVQINAGQTLFKAGEDADALYLIISGRIRAFEPIHTPKLYELTAEEESPGDSKFNLNRSIAPLYELSRGDICGDCNFFDDEDDAPQIRKVTSIAVRSSQLVRFSLASFRALLTAFPITMTSFSQALARRAEQLLVKRRQRLNQNVCTIAIVPLHGSMTDTMNELQSPLGQFLTLLESVLWEHGPTILPTRASRPTVDDNDEVSRAIYANWFTELEEDHRFVLLLCEGDDVWSRTSVEHADMVLLLGDDTESPAVSSAEHNLCWKPYLKSLEFGADMPHYDIARSFQLVLLHPSGCKLPSGTKTWLNYRPHLTAWHHVRKGVVSDHQRLSRCLADVSVGLVLGGGGARGLAHLGVLRALEEGDIPIDSIAGCSQGAFMAALYATTSAQSVDEIFPSVRQWIKIFEPWRLLTALTLPILSYFDGWPFSRALRKQLGYSTTIEDLWIPYFCVMTNIRKSELQVQRRGLLWYYVRASMSVIGLVPPLIEGGDILVDGGYVNNLPVDLMAQQTRMVIAVDVEDKDNSANQDMYDYGGGVSGWWLFFEKLRGKRRVPVFGEIAAWLNSIAHSRNLREARRQNLVDLYIRPDVQRFQLLDYLKLDEIAEEGLKAGRACVAAYQLDQNKTPSPIPITRVSKEITETKDPVVLSRNPSLSMVPTSTARRRGSVVGNGLFAAAVPLALEKPQPMYLRSRSYGDVKRLNDV